MSRRKAAAITTHGLPNLNNYHGPFDCFKSLISLGCKAGFDFSSISWHASGGSRSKRPLHMRLTYLNT